jgi:hypothetical protein
MTGTAGAATWVYRQADGTYLTGGPDEIGGTREFASAERPLTPDGLPIPLQWNRLAARLLSGPVADALVAELDACGGRPDRELLGRLVAAVAADPSAPALLVAEGVRVECVRGGWVGMKSQARGIEVRVTCYL